MFSRVVEPVDLDFELAIDTVGQLDLVVALAVARVDSAYRDGVGCDPLDLGSVHRLPSNTE